MNWEKGSMYVKVYNDTIKECGKVDCGCEIIKTESPHITIKLCPDHTQEMVQTDVVYGTSMIYPMVDAPGTFENIHLAAVGSKEFD